MVEEPWEEIAELEPMLELAVEERMACTET